MHNSIKQLCLTAVAATCLWSGSAFAQPETVVNNPLNLQSEQREKFSTEFRARCFDSDRTRLDRSNVCKITNQRRSQYRRENLILDANLSRVAQRFAEDMDRRGYFSHVSPEGQTLGMRLRAGSADFGYAGENIARGQQSSMDVMNSWMNSPGHRANILKSQFRRIGIGHSGKVWVQVFTD